MDLHFQLGANLHFHFGAESQFRFGAHVRFISGQARIFTLSENLPALGRNRRRSETQPGEIPSGMLDFVPTPGRKWRDENGRSAKFYLGIVPIPGGGAAIFRLKM